MVNILGFWEYIKRFEFSFHLLCGIEGVGGRGRK
jgi:hypothetical protein